MGQLIDLLFNLRADSYIECALPLISLLTLRKCITLSNCAHIDYKCKLLYMTLYLSYE